MNRILLNKQKVEKEIGKGASGCVQKARYLKDESILLAIKKIALSKSKSATVQFLKDIKNEVEVLRSLDSPYIIKFVDQHATHDNIFIVSELCEGPELLDVVLEKGCLSEGECQLQFKQLLSAMFHCHSKNIIHRDIKAENIVFKEINCQNIKVIDFGLGLKGCNTTTGICGTPFQMAPEIFKTKIYDTRQDVWSLGVLLQVMITGYPPFPGKDHKEIIKNILKKEPEYDLDEFKSTSPEAIKLIKKFLTKDPEKRIKLDDALNDAWFSKLETIPVSEEIKAKSVEKMKSQQQSNKFTKAIRMCMNKLQTTSSLEDLKVTFFEQDDNKNGILDRTEFTRVLHKQGFDDSEVDQMIEAVDLNGDGEIEFSEFISGCTNFDQANLIVASEVIFDIIDKDGSGKMDKDEFRKFFTSQNIPQNMAELDKIFIELDEDGDGTVDIQEFSSKFKLQFE